MAIGNDRIGETRTMNCGLKATIVEYRDYKDIDVQFEDGKVRQHVRYEHFQNGDISHPDAMRKDHHEHRLGETSIMRCGLKATIIEYRASNDIDVKFETGEIRTNVRYDHFKNGAINNVAVVRGDEAQQRVGETRIMNCGLKATIIAYRRSDDIDVQFETGKIRHHTCYGHFLNGRINPIKVVTCDQSRVGECNLMSNGQIATIIAYRRSDDMDVEFEDGTVRAGVSYEMFQKGYISTSPKVKCDQSRVGESKVMNNGLVATIVAYRKHADMDVEFEDGVKVSGVGYSHFQDGVISHPTIKFNNSTSIQEFAVYYYMRNYGFKKIDRGEWKDRGFGKFELDLYDENKNVAVEVDGGWHAKERPAERELRKNQKCRELEIKLYRLRDASLPEINDDWSINFVLDKQKTVSIGLIDCKYEIERILTENNIAFKDGDIDFKRDRDAILKEYYELHSDIYKKERIGQTNYSKPAKQNMTIIEYRAYTDLDVQFEDGAIRRGITYQAFKEGSVDHPNDTKDAKARVRLGEQRRMNNGMTATVIAYRSYKDIDVEFEDGVIRYNVSYGQFKCGGIDRVRRQANTKTENRVGERRQMNCGFYATIIEYRNSNDMDVQFENGAIRRGVRYYSFSIGRVALPKK